MRRAALSLGLLLLPALASAAPECGPVRVSPKEIVVGESARIALPTPRQGERLEALERALGRGCAKIELEIDAEVPFLIAYAAIRTSAHRSKGGVVLALGGAKVHIAGGLGELARNSVMIDVAPDRARFRLLLSAGVPKPGSELAKLGATMPSPDRAALDARLAALDAQLPKPRSIFVGATADTPFGALSDAILAASARFPGLELSWID